MTYFENERLRGLDRLMRQIPNFAPRGHGVIAVCKTGVANKNCTAERIKAKNASRKEILTETMSNIRYQPFRKRLNKYIKESGTKLMDYRNEKHRLVFTEAIEKLNRNDYALMSALYLLTAEHRLWTAAKRHVVRNEIDFNNIRLRNSTVNAYALFCAAKDLYLGAKHITIRDLSDTELIGPKLFGLICNAMAIRRFGLGAIRRKEERKTEYD